MSKGSGLDNESSQERTSLTSYNLSANASASHRPSHLTIPQPYSHLNLSAYHIPNAQISIDKSTITILSAPLTSDPIALEAFLVQQIHLPPRPTVRIRANIPNQLLPLFDIQFDFLRHLSPDAARHAQWAYTTVQGQDESREPILLEDKHALFSDRPDPTRAGFWLRRFCVSGASNATKRLIFRRRVTNWDTAYLETSLQTFIKSTGYRGPPVIITFPVHYEKIVVQSPHRVNALVTGLQNLFVSTKTYEPLTAVWPYALSSRNAGSTPADSNTRQVMYQDEDDWLVEWREVIQVAMANRRVGWLGDADKVDAAIEGPAIAASMKSKIEL